MTEPAHWLDWNGAAVARFIGPDPTTRATAAHQWRVVCQRDGCCVLYGDTSVEAVQKGHDAREVAHMPLRLQRLHEDGVWHDEAE